jgi:hypothetical protein
VTTSGEAVPGPARFDGADPRALRAATRDVVDYRGDVTIERGSDPAPLVGYVFDVVAGAAPGDDRLRLLPADGGAAVTVRLDDVRAIELTGRDTAAGKSFETWVRRYAERKLGLEAGTLTGGDGAAS